MRPSTLGILGLGALGGSIARRAKVAGIPVVLGWSPELIARGVAVRQGALDDALSSPRAVVERAELVVITLPLRACCALLESLGPLPSSSVLVTDTAPVKRSVVAAAERGGLGTRFAGSHPLVRIQGGFEESRADLFREGTVYVTPARGGETAAREIAHFWESVCEAHTVTLDAPSHDAQLALTDQVPQAMAMLLARFLAQSLPPGAALGVAAREATRPALVDPIQWAEVLVENRDKLLPVLAQMQAPLEALERSLVQGDVRAVQDWLDAAARWRWGIGP